MANKYANLVGTNKIKDEYSKINTGFDKVEADINKLKTDVTAVNTRVDTIITTPISGQAATQEIVDARVSAVKSKTFATLDARFEEMEQDIATHHKNLLHNWDFRNPVNQRGQTEYTSGYTIDRWSISNSGIARIKNGSIELESTNTGESCPALVFLQPIENSQLYDGKTVTVSVEIGGQIYSGTGVINLSQGTATFATAHFSEGAYAQVEYVTAEQYGIPVLRFRFVIYPGITVSNITRAKLEFGSISTLANDTLADYGEQLMLCKRFFRLWKTAEARTAALQEVGLMRLENPTLGTINIGGTTYYYASADL